MRFLGSVVLGEGGCGGFWGEVLGGVFLAMFLERVFEKRVFDNFW